ncbi:mediator of RNA polymerase II transcription subunit 1 isoform X8 [Tachysurus fulvidraco]|uniref:mediator of RNA polymerase II transcription subunit 1 isoform X8 n=1 Tax=Tachysurus fulvidraco TaxID=1234273 RepID=UPI001FEF04F7|nr:mediator of RNA polymerase II transcription subunit 1 isoform X8 [Tachysurus fulvidraco]
MHCLLTLHKKPKTQEEIKNKAVMESEVDVMKKTYLSELSSKYSEKPWSETFQLVHRCMGKARTHSRDSEPVMRCLQKLQEAQNVKSLSAMVSRLERIAKQKGLGSHLSPTETACYLTADLFYVEVLLLPGGEVEDVKVAKQGEAPESNASLFQMLRHLIESDAHVDMVLNGRIGRITPSSEGSPMSIEYYISPSDALIERLQPGEGSGSQTAVLVVGASATTHRLQMESLIPTPPQVNSQGLPAFIPLSETCSELLPASFLLKLKPPVPMLNSFIHKMSQITDVDLQGEPLFQLLHSNALKDKRSCGGNDAHFLVSLPDAEFHSYLFADAEWKCDVWKGSLIHKIPFTHPSHVPAILDLLRYQSAINTLLRSCITSLMHQPEIEFDLSCEILPESECSFSVTFNILDSETLAVLLVSVLDCRHLSCRLLMPGPVDHALDDYISRVLTRCMSIPITLRAIRKRITSLRPPALPLESDSAKNPESSSSILARSPENTSVVLPSAVLSPEPMEEDKLPTTSGHYVMSVAAASAVDGANTDVIANRSPCASVGVYSNWVASSFPAKLI